MTLHSLKNRDTGAQGQFHANKVCVPGLEHFIGDQKDGGAFGVGMGTRVHNIAVFDKETKDGGESHKHTKTVLLHA
jgi:hypothetical protein